MSEHGIKLIGGKKLQTTLNKKIVSFGDSFVWGSEQKNNDDGSLGWVGRAAKNLGCTYNTRARPGCGNDYIAQQIYSWFSSNTSQDTLAVINWTWISRWDCYIVDHKTWITLGPSCVPLNLKELVDKTQANDMVEFYRTRINAGILWNKFRNLQTIWAAQSFLKQKNITNIQTYMDYDLFDMACEHDGLTPDYINELQKLVYPEMQLFDNKNFVDWSRQNGFTVTKSMHPLEDAHIAAAALWQDRYAKALNI